MSQLTQTPVAEAPSPIRKGVIFDRPGCKAVRLQVRAGGVVPTHSSNADVIATVVRGAGVFTIAGREHGLAPGVVLEMAPGVEHSIRAQEELEIVVLHCRLNLGGAVPVSCGAEG